MLRNRFIAVPASRHYSPFAISLEENEAGFALCIAFASITNLASDTSAEGLLARAESNPELLSPDRPLLPKEVVATNLSYRAGVSLSSVTLSVDLSLDGEVRSADFALSHVVPDVALLDASAADAHELLWKVCSICAEYRQKKGFCAHADQSRGWLIDRHGTPEVWTDPVRYRSRLALRELSSLVEEAAAAHLTSRNVPHIISGMLGFVPETNGTSRHATAVFMTSANPEVWPESGYYPDRPTPMGWIGEDLIASLNQHQLESTLSSARKPLTQQTLKGALKVSRKSRDWIDHACHGPRLSRTHIGAMIGSGALRVHWDELGKPAWKVIEPSTSVRDGFLSTMTADPRAAFVSSKILDGIIEWFSIEECAPFAATLLDLAGSYRDASFALLLRWQAAGFLTDLRVDNSVKIQGKRSVNVCSGNATTASGMQVSASIQKATAKEAKWDVSYRLVEQLLRVKHRMKPLSVQTSVPKPENSIENEIRSLETEIRRLCPGRIVFQYSEDSAGHSCIARTGSFRRPFIGASTGIATQRKARVAALRDLRNVCLGKPSGQTVVKNSEALKTLAVVRQRWEHELSTRMVEGWEMDEGRNVALRRFLAQTVPGRGGVEPLSQKDMVLLGEEINQRQSMTTPKGRFAAGVKLIQTLFTSVDDVQYNDYTQRLAIRLGILRDEITPLLLDTGLAVRQDARLELSTRGRRAMRKDAEPEFAGRKHATLADAVDSSTLEVLLSSLQ